VGKFTDELNEKFGPVDGNSTAAGLALVADAIFESFKYMVDSMENQEARFASMLKKMADAQDLYDFSACGGHCSCSDEEN